MKLGKIMFVSMLLLVILAVGAVSASDANDTLKATDDDNILESANGFEDKLEINEANDVLKATPKTFTELNATINGNKDSEIYLDSNYTYESGTDNKFRAGVVIDRAVTVYGNGYTLNGNNAARIFLVKNSNVIFKDIFFVNGKATEDDYADYRDDGHGGAINGNCTAINCIFNSNYASEYGSGGAMYNGSAVNCTFNSNFAIYGGAMYGGSAVNCIFNSNSWSAMYYGSAVNCTFVNNSGAVGGAMYGGSAVNCTFNFNSAVDGGAMSNGSAVNCTFNFNSADEGGAMSDSNAVNCTFNSNSASYYGGAMYVNHYDTIKHMATGCVFTNNTAKNGGATYYIYANNCQFNKNTATENGGAMYDCNAEDSTFAQNHADGEGGAVYNVVVSNCLFEYNSATNGGAMSRSKTSNSKFNHNTATNYGGAVYDSKVSTNSEFNDNNAPNGENTYNETWFNPENTKTFTDLNELINNNNETNIYLNSNYAFDSCDFLFKEGIIISRAVTVWGNGYTISGEGLARIFAVKNIDVVFKDIIFVNGKATRNTYGGAINGECTAINCTFNSNSHAMYYGSAVNCTFNSNSGGIFNGYAVNCIFMNNSNVMSDCNAVNCTFNSNFASDGGAISFSIAVNCTFVNNSAKWDGGAISEGSAVNCTFVNNFAGEYGGAIAFGSAVNCTFVNNFAEGDGGAIYNCDAVNCTFINNKATGNGSAVYSRFPDDTVINCTFINCSVNVVYANYNTTIIANCTFETQGSETLRELVIGGNASNCTVKKYKDKTATNITITVNDITYGETLNIIVNVQKDATGNMTLTINTKDYTANIENGQAAFNITGLNAGNYEVKVDYAGDSNYMAAQNITQICVNKVSTAITSSAVTTIYNVNKNLIITLKDAEGNPLGGVDIIVNLNGAQTYTTGNNGQVKVSTKGLTPKTYTAKITFKGNTNYDKSARNVKVTVKKATPKLSAKAKTFKKSVKTKKYTVTLKTNTNKVMKNTKLTLKVNGKTYTAKTNAKGQATFKITKLTKKGKFTAVVKFAGNKYYNAKTVKPKIIVK